MARTTKGPSRTTATQTGHKKGPDYTHLTKLRCPRCRVVMRAVGTRDNGRVKRWLCPAPVCRKRTETIGKEI